jgi:hypothetical protein
LERFEAAPFTNARVHLQAAHAVFQAYLGRGSQLEVNVDDRCRRAIMNQLASLGRAWAISEARATQSDPESVFADPLFSSELAGMSLAGQDVPESFTSSSLTVGLRNVFIPAKKSILLLLEGSYSTFSRSVFYSRMMTELSGKSKMGDTVSTDELPPPSPPSRPDYPSMRFSCIMYTKAAQQSALNVVAEYMQEHELIEMDEDGENNPAPVSERSSTFLQPHATGPRDQSRRMLLRRMLQGFCSTLLGVDIVDYAAM